ncbi:MAG: hypothetical protein IPP14_00025 [Planctomycetes bacterium]|nr:hypothetical protein [Planctomycetota bacterium]
MELLRNNTRQQDDPHGLAAVGELLRFGTSDDFEDRIRQHLPEIRRVRALLDRVRELTPGVEFSPYVTRVLNLAEKAESARLAEVA